MADKLTAEGIKNRILCDLGGGPVTPEDEARGAVGVNIELTDAQFKTAIQDAELWFIEKKGWTIWRPIPCNVGQCDYQMKDDVVNILDVIFEVPTDVAAFFTLGFFDIIPYGPHNINGIGQAGISSYTGFMQLLEFNEQRKRVFSVEPQWFFDEQVKMLHITQRSGAIGTIMLCQVKLNTFDITKLTGKDTSIVYRYIKAKCKEILGRIRSKYDTLPAASGTVSMDGTRLIEEAKKEFEDLDKMIFASQGPDAAILAG